MTIGKALTSSPMAFAGSVVADEFERNVTLRKRNAPASSKKRDSISVVRLVREESQFPG